MWSQYPLRTHKDHRCFSHSFGFVSTSLLVLSALAGAVGSLSVVVMIPFASTYGTTLTSAIATGMGSNGVVAGVISLIQNPQSKNPYFTVEVYFYIVLSFIVVSIICALIVIFYPKITEDFDIVKNYQWDQIPDNEDRKEEKIYSNFELSKEIYVQVLNECYISIMNYTTIGLIPYLSVGFDDKSKDIIIFWLTWSYVIAGALGRLLSAIKYFYSLKIFTVAQVILWSYLVAQCFVQQEIKLPEFCGWIAVVVNGIYSALYGYVDTVNYHKVAKILQDKPHLIERASSIVGFSNQVGAIIGSLVGFALVLKVLHT